MGIMTRRIDALLPPVEKLAPEAEKELELEVGQILTGRSENEIKSFLAALRSLILHFCEFEQRNTSKRLSEIKTELRQLGRHIDTLQAAISRLSVQAQMEFDFDMYPGFEFPENFLAAERPFVKRNPVQNTRRKQGQTIPTKQPAPPSTYYIDPVVMTLTRLRTAVNEVLTDAFVPMPPGATTKKNKGGAPYRAAWHHLAWEVARTMQRKLSLEASAKSNAHFELLLQACLKAGLATIGSKTHVPDDLRQYTRAAIRRLKASSA